MKRCMVLGLALALALSAGGCGGQLGEKGGEDRILREPPALTVSLEKTTVEALRGGYAWTFDNGDGTSTENLADSMHPLQAGDCTPCLSLPAGGAEGTLTAFLTFTEAPDRVEVRRWSEACWGMNDAGDQEIPVETEESEGRLSLPLARGGWIYQVEAEWSGEGWGGTADYSFWSVPGETASFSWEEVQGEYGEDDPGVQWEGFANSSAGTAADNRAAALQLALAECTVDWNAVEVRRDAGAGMWSVCFFTEDFVGGDQTVYLEDSGATRLIVWGE